MSNTLFLTPRLRCRRWQPDDLETLCAVYGDPRVVRFVGDGTPATREGCTQWLDVTARNYALRGYGMFALDALDVRNAEGQSPVGFCGLVHPGGQPEPEVKYAFAPAHWGRGYATEAVAALLRHGQQAWGLHRIIATVAPANEPSRQVMHKVGARLDHLRDNGDGTSTCVFVWPAGA